PPKNVNVQALRHTPSVGGEFLSILRDCDLTGSVPIAVLNFLSLIVRPISSASFTTPPVELRYTVVPASKLFERTQSRNSSADSPSIPPSRKITPSNPGSFPLLTGGV